MPTTPSPRSPSRARSRAGVALVVSAAVALGGAGVFAVRALRHDARVVGAASSPASNSVGVAWRARWTPGFEYTFTFAWSGETHATITHSARGDASYDVAGTLVARALEDPSRTLLELRFERFSRHALQAFGHDVVPDAELHASLEEPRAWAVVAPSGSIQRLRFFPDAPKPFRELMTKVVEQMQVTAAGGPATEWTAVEPGPNGRAEATYRVTDAAMLGVTRTRTRYAALSSLAGGSCADCDQQLTDRASLTLDPRGVVATLDDDETLHVVQKGGGEVLGATNRFQLRLVGMEGAGGAVAVAGAVMDERTPGERADLTARDEDAILRSEAAGVTGEQIDGAIDLFARTGERVADKAWLVHARAYLLLNPEALESLARRLDAPGTTARGRNMMMQVLAVVGSPRAQEILRAELDAEWAKGDRRGLGLLAQKLGVVEHPTAETTAYVADAYRVARARGDRGMALAEAATLGSIASKLAKGGDSGEARSLVSRLDADLRAATDPEEKRGLVLALRNAGAVDQDDVRALAADGSADVRGEVARSLADVSSSSARDTLRSLCLDGETTVATTALQSLGRDAPTADDVRAIASAVLSGKTSAAVDGSVMDFFSANLASPDAAPVLGFLLERTKNPALARRLRQLIEQLPT